MFQDMNVAKSAPFALLAIYKLPCMPPQSYQKAPIFVNHAKICRPFSNLPTGKWHPPNLQRIQQNLLNLPTIGKNHVKFV